jgi:anthranilate 1,2-dioxygenase small subunit
MPASFFYCSGRGMLHDRVLALRRANIYEPHYYRHLVSGTRLVCQEPTEWRFYTNFQVIRTMKTGEMSVFAVGLFNDLIVASETQVLFKEKIVVCDSSRVDTLLVIPI